MKDKSASKLDATTKFASSPQGRKGALLVIILRVSSASTFVMALQLVETAKPFATLAATVTSNLLMNIADMAYIICPALEWPSADTTKECWHLQVASRMRSQFTLGWECLLTLVALEPPGSRGRSCRTQICCPGCAGLVWRLARSDRGSRRRWRRGRAKVSVIGASASGRALRLQCKIITIDWDRRTRVTTIGRVRESIVGRRWRR